MNPAYAYIYDDFLVDRRYQDILAALETRLASLGLSGRIGRLALFRSARELVEGFVDQGVQNIVIVGNDITLNKVMWFLPDLPVVVGYIPIAEPAHMAALLGIPVGLGACDVLGARLIETLDMGKLGDRYFLTEAVFENTTASLQVNKNYKLSLIKGGNIIFRNLGGVTKDGYAMADARDGKLEVLIQPHYEKNLKTKILDRIKSNKDNETRMFFENGEIVSKQPVEARADMFAVSGFEFKVSVIPNKLRMIVGRARRFDALR
ncbi:hypothetical protein KKG46_04695 [Patescibacteria group bacterium]|nr:hypothetical protein [Patescibacteria group bacterium]